MVTRKLLQYSIAFALGAYIVYGLITYPMLSHDAPVVTVLDGEIVRVLDKDLQDVYFLKPRADTSMPLTEREIPVEEFGHQITKVTPMTVAQMRNFFAEKIPAEEWLNVVEALTCLEAQKSGC